MQYIPYGHQDISQEDVEAVVEILKSDWLTQGPAVSRFEEAVARYCGTKYAVAVNSATSALHIACLAVGLSKGDILWTSPNTFVASANCGLYCGANINFIDIDSRTYNLSPEALAEKLKKAKIDGCLPKVVIPVHFSGQSCEMERINELAKEYGFYIIEDASHAIGGNYRNKKIGSCFFSDMTVFSFHPVKLITTGEGGMVLTNNRELYEKLVLFRSHGITRDQAMLTEKHGPWYYQQMDLGFNYRITDIQAALGLSQLQRLDEFVARRHTISERYNQELQGLPLVLPWQHADVNSAYHLYVICLKLEQIKKSRLEIFQELRTAGIGVNVHYIPVHTQPYYRKLGFKSGDFPISELYYQSAISIPMYASLKYEEQTYVIKKLHEVLR